MLLLRNCQTRLGLRNRRARSVVSCLGVVELLRSGRIRRTQLSRSAKVVLRALGLRVGAIQLRLGRLHLSPGTRDRIHRAGNHGPRTCESAFDSRADHMFLGERDVQLRIRDVQLGYRLRGPGSELHVVELENQVAFLDRLIVGDRALDDFAADFGGELHDVSLYLSIIRGLLSPRHRKIGAQGKQRRAESSSKD